MFNLDFFFQESAVVEKKLKYSILKKIPNVKKSFRIFWFHTKHKSLVSWLMA